MSLGISLDIQREDFWMMAPIAVNVSERRCFSVTYKKEGMY